MEGIVFFNFFKIIIFFIKVLRAMLIYLQYL